MNSTSIQIGQTDNHRRERLLELSNLLNRSDGGTVNLRWPDFGQVLSDNHRRELTGPGYPNAGLQTFEQQIRGHSAIARAGASFITLPVVQDASLPSIDRAQKASWVGTSADVAPILETVTSSPKRLSAFITASKELTKLSPVLAGAFLEKQLLSAIGAALDEASIIGSGTDEPFGILADPAVLEHEFTTSITAADILAMEKAVADAHGEADPAAMTWLADTATREALRALPRLSGGSTPLWPDGVNAGPLGYRGTGSPWAPADTLIFGNFNDLLVLQSDSVEITSNPYTAADTTGFVRMLISGWFDIVALNPSSSFVRAVAAE